jgi:hypothetical protein
VFRFDFTSPEYLRDPATGLAKLRAAGPVVEVRFPIIGRTWITTTNEMAGRILKDHATFRMRRDGSLAGIRWWMPRWLRSFAASMLTMDEPDHTRLRSTVEEAFRRRAILDMEPRILALADALAAELFAERRTSERPPREHGGEHQILSRSEASLAEPSFRRPTATYAPQSRPDRTPWDSGRSRSESAAGPWASPLAPRSVCYGGPKLLLELRLAMS